MLTTVVSALACLVHLITAGIIAAAILLLAAAPGVPLWLRIIGAGLLLAVAYFVQPFRRRRQRRIEVERHEAPSLFALIDGVAKSINAPTIKRVALTFDFNAFYTASAVRGRLLGIGMSLWTALDDEARVALLGHELAHAVNGDLRNTKLVARALTTLARWQELLRPDRPGPWRVVSRSSEQALINLVEQVFLPIVLMPIVVIIGTFGWALETLANRQGQRREYYADELAARAAGTKGAIDMAQSLLIGDICLHTLSHSVKFERQSDPWLRLRSVVKDIPSSEWERRSRLARRRLNRIDVTHPPSQFRVDLLRERLSRPALVVLDPSTSARIEEELEPAKKRLALQLRDILGAV